MPVTGLPPFFSVLQAIIPCPGTILPPVKSHPQGLQSVAKRRRGAGCVTFQKGCQLYQMGVFLLRVNVPDQGFFGQQTPNQRVFTAHYVDIAVAQQKVVVVLTEKGDGLQVQTPGPVSLLQGQGNARLLQGVQCLALGHQYHHRPGGGLPDFKQAEQRRVLVAKQ